MTPPVPTPRFSCLCGEPYMVASLDPANDNGAIQRHACPCERPVLPIFEPDAKAASVLAVCLLLAVLGLIVAAGCWLGVATT